jgi:enoyl-CoA hydratase
MKLKNVLVEKKEGIAKVTLNRPEALNALDETTYDELWLAVEDVRVDQGIRVVIVTGAGRAFCAGLDLGYGEKLSEVAPQKFRAIMHKIQETFRLERLEKPVIAAVNGYALGNGCDLALACDFRIASENARFGMTYTQLGLVPDVGGAYRLTRLVGVSKAKELIYTGITIDAKEAQRIGIVDKVVSAEDLDSTALDFAKNLAKGAPMAIGLSKMAINNSLDADLKTALEFDVNAQSLCIKSEDAREGMVARAQKREPVFKGK